MATGALTIDLVGCARCRGDGHPGLVFRLLTFPVEFDVAEQEPFTHWAPCPANKEPILLSTRVREA